MTNTTSTKKLIILIHGAGQGSYIWRELCELLTLPFLAIDFPNRNPSIISNSKLSFDDYVKSAVSQIESVEFENLIIVTSSIGGVVGLKVAKYFGDKVAGFVAISSAISQKGGSFISCLPFPQKIILPLIMKLIGTKPPKNAIEESMCNDLTQIQKDMVTSNFTPESILLYTQKCKSNVPKCKKLYIKLILDKEFEPLLQDQMAKNLGTENILEINSGHLPMISKPPDLAKILNSFAVTCD
jgi:Alpha/beta hydrolase family